VTWSRLCAREWDLDERNWRRPPLMQGDACVAPTKGLASPTADRVGTAREML
jgi:hypothetical protein